MCAFKVLQNARMESTKLAESCHNIMVALQDDEGAVVLWGMPKVSKETWK